MNKFIGYDKNFTRKKSPVIGLLVLLIFLLSGCDDSGSGKAYVDTGEANTGVEKDENNSGEHRSYGETESEYKQMTENAYVYVQVCGAIKNPGVYKVDSTWRVYEVIDAAGGVTDEADTDVVNMARPVVDEMMVYIPTRDEVSSGVYELDSAGLESNYPEMEDGLVDINQAGKEELMTLPGIGEAKADAIIEYREKNGRFTEISEIMNISGIKQAAFDKIKDLIKV